MFPFNALKQPRHVLNIDMLTKKDSDFFSSINVLFINLTAEYVNNAR